jgi:hypothetical protein
VTPEDVDAARRMYAETAPVRAELDKVQATRPLVACVDMVPGLCDEVVRGWAGLRQVNADRERLRSELEACESDLYDTVAALKSCRRERDVAEHSLKAAAVWLEAGELNKLRDLLIGQDR